jgi:hypothetical protein
MPDGSTLPLLDHQLADDELAWVSSIYHDFSATRAAFAGPVAAFDPKQTLREILGREKHRLPTPMDLSGDGVWRGGRNNQGRSVACVFLKHVELHRHPFSRTDQFPMYVVGAADAYAEDEQARPMLTPVTGGDHFHNAPGAPHAFLPRVGEPAGDDWEIAFIAITPRNLQEDTVAVSETTKAGYKQVVGQEAPSRV